MKRAPEHLVPVSGFRNSVVALAQRLRHAIRADSENWTALMVLGAVERAKGVATPTQVAAELGLHSSNLAQVLGELDQRGLVLRTPDEADKRKVRLSLTQAGIDVAHESRGRRDQWLSDAMKACLTAEEQTQLLAAGALIQRVAQWSEPSSGSSD